MIRSKVMHINTCKANPGSEEDPKVKIFNFLHRSHFSFGGDVDLPGVPKRPYDISSPHMHIIYLFILFQSFPNMT